MGLKNIAFKGLYDSDVDDILNEFYIPSLQNAIYYQRIAGYFSSNAFAISMKGIESFIGHGGNIDMIVNVVLSEKDQNAIIEAIRDKENGVLDEISDLSDSLKMGHIRLLAWMIKQERLNIKVAVVTDGIEHKKKGIFYDKERNIISFSGSDNETRKGWLDNDEEFHVFCSWVDGDFERHLKPDIERFNSLWDKDENAYNNGNDRVKIYPISKAFRLGLIVMSLNILDLTQSKEGDILGHRNYLFHNPDI